jgi:hypothetical protein
METVNSLIVEQVKRFEVDFLYSMAKAKVLVGGQRIRGDDGSVLEPKPGSVVEVSRWVAEELIRGGIASLQEDVQVDRVYLNRLRWLETSISSEALRPLPRCFYPRVRRYLQTVKATSPELVNEIDGALREVFNARIRKLLRLAFAPSIPPDAHASMQPEERVLFDLIRSSLSSWKEGVLGV